MLLYTELARFASKLKQRARHPVPPTVSVLYPPSDTERHPLGNTVPCVIMFNPKLPYMFGSPAPTAFPLIGNNEFCR